MDEINDKAETFPCQLCKNFSLLQRGKVSNFNTWEITNSLFYKCWVVQLEVKDVSIDWKTFPIFGVMKIDFKPSYLNQMSLWSALASCGFGNWLGLRTWMTRIRVSLETYFEHNYEKPHGLINYQRNFNVQTLCSSRLKTKCCRLENE